MRAADAEQLFGGAQILLSAGGSGYFDLVARGFAGVRDLSRPVLPVLRSGCYLTSDHGSYLRQIGDLDAREGGHAALGGEGLRPGAGSVEHGAVAPRAAAWRSSPWASATPPTTSSCRSRC